MSRPVRIAVTLVAFVALALTLSACIVVKPGSVQLSQPGGIGDLNVDFKLCTSSESGQSPPPCSSDDYTGKAQVVVGFLIPKGATNPASDFTANAVEPGVAPLVFHRDQQFEARYNDKGKFPDGFELFGYLSEVTEEQQTTNREWSAKSHFGLPLPADGSSYAGPLKYYVVYGWREVDDTQPADRPLGCDTEDEPLPDSAECTSTGELEFGVSDLRIKPMAETSVYAGGTAAVPFSLDFASSSSTPPSSFALSGVTTLPGAVAAPAELTFVPGPLGPSKHSVGQRLVNVQVPAKAKTGAYQVQLVATTPTGGSASAIGQIQVLTARVGIKAKLNKARGTALLTLKVPAAGTLTVAGKGTVKVQRKPDVAKTVKVTVRAKGKAKKKLLATGKAKVVAKVKFQPTGAAATTATKPLTLKLTG